MLGIMTKLTDGVDFINWGYRNDDTHICFYSKKTFLWVAEKFDLNIEFLAGDVMLLRATEADKARENS